MVYPTVPMEERFWARVRKTRGCWNWDKPTRRGGYGSINKPGHSAGFVYAHRYSWELHFGPIPDGLLVLHKCDNPACVRPSHLFLGDHGDNARDRSAKGRGWEQRKTHCPQGHEYTEENTYRYKNKRQCRTCSRARDKARRPKMEKTA